MSGPTGFGGHQGQSRSPHVAASDEAPRSRTLRGTGAASEAEGKRGSTWGQGDAAIRGGSVWQRGMEVVQTDRARSGVRREKGVPGEGHQARRVRGEGMTESGGSVDPLEKKGKVEALARDAGGGASSGLRRSSRAKSSWTPFRRIAVQEGERLESSHDRQNYKSCLPWGVTAQRGAQGSTTGGAGTGHRSSRQKTGCT